MTTSKKGFLSNVPPLVKLGSIFGFTVAAVVIYILSSGESAPTVDSVPEVSGKSSIGISVASETLKTKAEVSEIPKDSEEAKVIKDLKKKVVDSARGSQSSFIEEIELSNTEKLLEDIDTNLSKAESTNGLLIADKSSRLEREQEKLKLLQKRSAVIKNSANEPGSGSASYQEERIRADEAAAREKEMMDSFLEKELSASPNRIGASSIGASIAGVSSFTAGGMSTSEYKRETNSKNDEPKGLDALRARQQKSAQRQLDMISDVQKMTASYISGSRNRSASVSGPETSRPSNETIQNPSSDEPAGPYISTGEMFYSVLQFSVNTDEISPVRAVVVEPGPLKGAVLVGMPQRTGKSVRIQFSSMSLNGRDYSINVVALDPNTMRTAFADDVDSHTFERYFKLATAAALSGYAEALTQRRTVTRPDGSTEEISNSLPEGKDQAKYALGKVGEALVPIYEDGFDRPPTVRVNGDNRDLGIMFMSGLQL